MSNYDPVDKDILHKVLGIDRQFIQNNRNIFNSINSYLRPAINHKNISEKMIRLSGLTNGVNERITKPSINDAYDIHDKFLKPRPNVVDMTDYKKEFEPKIEKEMMPEILDNEEEENFYNRFGFPEEDEGERKELRKEIEETYKYIKKYYGDLESAPKKLQENLREFENKLKDLEGSGRRRKGKGKVPKHLKIGNDKLAGFNYIGLDNLNNEFKKLSKISSSSDDTRKGGARTGYPAVKGVKKLNKKKVNMLKKSIKYNPLEDEQEQEFRNQRKSMTGAIIDKSRKIGGSGRNAYIQKLKDLVKQKGITYKEAMIEYSKNK